MVKRFGEFGMKVRVAALKDIIQDLEQDEMDSGLTLRMDSKYLDKVLIRFRGPGIKEMDEYEEMIQRRTVRLKRWKLTEEFIP